MGWELKKARNLFTEILRDPSYDHASCLAFVIGFICLFLWQVEPLLWSRGIFKVFEEYEGRWPLELHPLSGFWLFPFEWVPPSLRGGLWIPAAIVCFANALLLDRFIAKHGGCDVSFRLWILRLRRLFAGIPLLGLCIIPLWRILCNRRPGWACRRTAPRPVLEGDPPELELLQGGEYLHSAPFILWILVSNPFALRAALAWLNEPERATATGLLVVQGICGGLRLGGLVCMVAYIRVRSREGELWGRRKWGLLLCSGAWLLPQSLFLIAVLAILLGGERWGTVMEDARVRSKPAREADRAIGSRLPTINLQTVALNEAARKVLRLYREKTFLLMTEVASVLMLVVPAREQFPWLNLPGCLVALLCLVNLLMLPIGAVLYLRSFFSMISGPAERMRRQAEHPFARYLLLTSTAVVGGYYIGVLAGARQLDMLAISFFWIGAFGTMIGFPAALWGLIRMDEKPLLIWPMLFMMIGMTGYEMQHGSSRLLKLGTGPAVEDVEKFHLFKLYLMIPVVLLLTIFMGLYRCRWLVRPFRVRDIFSPSLPWPLRRRLVFLIVTACLPLGGCLVPLWIRMRSTLAGPDLNC